MTDDEQLHLDGRAKKCSRYAMFLNALSGLGGFSFGYDMAVISGAMILLKEDFALSYSWQTALITATIGAAGLFALIGAALNERFGRKPVIMSGSFLFSLGAILAASANGKNMLLAGRCIVGVGIGLLSMTCPVYMSEIAPSHYRGRFVSSFIVCIAAGQLLASLIDAAFAEATGGSWRLMLAFAAIPSLVQLFGFVVSPESPQWLIAHGRPEAARLSMRKLRGDGVDFEEDFNMLRMSTEEEYGSSAVGKRSVFSEFISHPPLRRAFLVGCGLQCMQQFVGINTILYYNATIIQMTGIQGHATVLWIACGLCAMYFFWTTVNVYLVGRIGRRPLTLLSLLGIFISLIIIAVGFQVESYNSPMVTFEDDMPRGLRDPCSNHISCELCTMDPNCGYCYLADETTTEGLCATAASETDTGHSAVGRCANMTLASKYGFHWSYHACPGPYPWIPIIGLILYLSSFALGMATMPITIGSEIYPFWARNVGMAVGTACNWISALILTAVFLPLMSRSSKYGVFWFYAGVTAVAALFVFFVVPETKGRKAEELESLFATPWTYTDSSSLLPAEKPVKYVHIRGLNRDGNKSIDESDEE